MLKLQLLVILFMKMMDDIINRNNKGFWEDMEQRSSHGKRQWEPPPDLCPSIEGALFCNSINIDTLKCHSWK